MFIYGKTATNGIAVMSYLAGIAPRRAGSEEIAAGRKISRMLTAKLLTQLSAAGLVSGQPGPGGGYTLARDPDDIRLADIVGLFTHGEEPSPCPFGSGWCGVGDPCPLHATITSLMEAHRAFLENTRLSVFQAGGGVLPVLHLPQTPPRDAQYHKNP
ncbi:MAG: Rrf2 family transcriptional regulator [Verrucomicrobia bacterium]|nr:Rrf2 family transcriptional regulator [Verrucomicrobiota bacterium]